MFGVIMLYLQKMDRKQLTERRTRFKWWSNRIEKGKVVERTELNLPIYINNKVEANGICKKRHTTKQRLWRSD